LSKGVIENKLEKARLIFEHLDGYYENLVPVDGLHSFLETKGLFVDHSPTLMRQVKSITEDDQIHWSAFAKFLIEKENVLKRAVTDELIIPNWSNFCLHMNNIYWECMESEEGVCPEEFEFENLNQFGVTIVSVDGQIFEVGDNDNHTPMHALISPFLYAIDIEDHGYDKIHEKIGKEPSPLRFDEIGLNIKKKPQNPLIHSGSLVCAEFVLPNQNISSKFKYVSKRIADFVDGKIGFDNKRYLSSKEKKDKLSSLAYYIAANEGFSNSNTIENISDTVDFLLQLYALEMSILQIATATATLANSGVCPLTAKKAISKNANLKTIQMMHSCGMYDVSGEWACSVGLPSKSGLNGLTMSLNFSF
jgi:glutaminase